MKKIIFFLLLIPLLSCGEKNDDLASQKEILDQIFLELIDSTFIEPLYIPPPPPPIPLYDSYLGSNKKVEDSIYKEASIRYYELKKQFESKVRDIKDLKAKKIIVVYDTIYQSEKGNEALLASHFNLANRKSRSYKINLSHYSENENYDFKYYSNLPTGWKPPFTRHLATYVTISTIHFDITQEYGLLEISILYGKRRSKSFICFIKKESGKWVIDELNETWAT